MVSKQGEYRFQMDATVQHTTCLKQLAGDLLIYTRNGVSRLDSTASTRPSSQFEFLVRTKCPTGLLITNLSLWLHKQSISKQFFFVSFVCFWYPIRLRKLTQFLGKGRTNCNRIFFTTMHFYKVPIMTN